MRLPAMFVCLSVCLLARLLKNACMDLDDIFVSTGVGTRTNDQHLSAIRIIVGMPEPDCFLRYRMHCNAEFYYVVKIPRAWLLGACRSSDATRGFEASKHRCRR